MEKKYNMVNIPRRNKDQFYRYKMPVLEAKTESRGNGIKTVVVNLSAIAKALNRPAIYINKYFGIILGAQTIIDTENGRYIVMGEHSAEKLSEHLDGYIDKYVMCRSCSSNPETHMTITKTKVTLKCASCGSVYQIPPGDRLWAYMTKNPVVMKSKMKETAKKKNLKEKKKVKGGIKDVEINDKSETNTKTNKEGENYEWKTDISEEAVKNRIDPTINVTNKLVSSSSLTEIEKNIQENKKNLMDKEIWEVTIQKIMKQKEENSIDDISFSRVFCCNIFDKNIRKNIIALIPSMKYVLKEENTLLEFLKVIETIAMKDGIYSELPHVLHALYEKDILLEDTFLKWYDSHDDPNIKESLKEFAEWLRKEEEEEDE